MHIRVQTTQNVSIQYPLASIGDRVLAHIIDILILILYTWGFIALASSIDVNLDLVWIIALSLPWTFYFLAFELLMDGQTPGKLVFKNKVVRLDGTPATTGDYILRWLLSLIEFTIGFGAIALVFVAASGKGQRLGDLVAGTSVIKLEEEKHLSSTIFVDTEDTYKPTFSQVTMLSARDIEIIKQVLEVNSTQGNYEPMEMLSEKIKPMLGIQTDLSSEDLLRTLLKDYNHLTSRSI